MNKDDFSLFDQLFPGARNKSTHGKGTPIHETTYDFRSQRPDVDSQKNDSQSDDGFRGTSADVPPTMNEEWLNDYYIKFQAMMDEMMGNATDGNSNIPLMLDIMVKREQGNIIDLQADEFSVGPIESVEPIQGRQKSDDRGNPARGSKS